jgi:hypothetical protein
MRQSRVVVDQGKQRGETTYWIDRSPDRIAPARTNSQFVSLRCGDSAPTSTTDRLRISSSGAGGNLGRRARSANTLSVRKSGFLSIRGSEAGRDGCGMTTDFRVVCKQANSAHYGLFASRLAPCTGNLLSLSDKLAGCLGRVSELARPSRIILQLHSPTTNRSGESRK